MLCGERVATLPTYDVEAKMRLIQQIIAAIALAALIAPFAVAEEQADDDFRRVEVFPPLATGMDVMDILASLMAGFPEQNERGPKIELIMISVDGAVHFDLIENGFADDSVAGQHHRGVIIRNANGWELKRLSHKWICARGDLSAEGLCP
ncbi:MAG: hypothetical protein AAF412_11210 [Pseudomonadota bacterium]